MHGNLLVLLLLPVAGQPGESWQYRDYVEVSSGNAPSTRVPLKSQGYGYQSPSYAAPQEAYTSQPSSQANRKLRDDNGWLGPATPPSESRILAALQNIPPQLRPNPPQQVHLVDASNKVIDKQDVMDAKAKYHNSTEDHLKMMDKQHVKEVEAMLEQLTTVRQDINHQVAEALQYKEELLEAEYQKGVQALKEQAETQKQNLYDRAKQMKDSRHASVDEKLLQAIRLLDSTTKQQAQLVRDAARSYERTFDEAIALLKDHQQKQEQELRQSQAEFDLRTREMSSGAEQKLKKHIETRLGLSFN